MIVSASLAQEGSVGQSSVSLAAELEEATYSALTAELIEWLEQITQLNPKYAGEYNSALSPTHPPIHSVTLIHSVNEFLQTKNNTTLLNLINHWYRIDSTRISNFSFVLTAMEMRGIVPTDDSQSVGTSAAAVALGGSGGSGGSDVSMNTATATPAAITDYVAAATTATTATTGSDFSRIATGKESAIALGSMNAQELSRQEHSSTGASGVGSQLGLKHSTEVGGGVRPPTPYVSTHVQSFVDLINMLRAGSEERYVHWMIAYELPGFAALADRMKSVGKRVSKDEMALFVRRQEVMKVAKDLEPKAFEAAVLSIRRRLAKHFKSPELYVQQCHFCYFAFFLKF